MISPYCEEHVQQLVPPIVEQNREKYIFPACSAKIFVENALYYKEFLSQMPKNLYYNLRFCADQDIAPEYVWDMDTEQWETYEGPPIQLGGKRILNFGSDHGFFLQNTGSKHKINVTTTLNPRYMTEIHQ